MTRVRAAVLTVGIILHLVALIVVSIVWLILSLVSTPMWAKVVIATIVWWWTIDKLYRGANSDPRYVALRYLASRR